MIRKCTCKHTFQDGQYGQGNRLHNTGKGGTVVRCTVCAKESKVKE